MTNYGTVKDLDESFILVTNDIEVQEFRDDYNFSENYNTLFVKANDGEVIKIYGCIGAPWFDSLLTELYPMSE